ncbi:MAG: CatB-related O-acetyltransferase, partial [Selenomonadaceae bacterium]|nr:CatB-related O-acetyltransferase [Selenomonadaceae bacterium]
LIFGVDDIFNELKPYYAREVQRGNLEIVAFAVLENNGIRLIPADGQSRGGGVNQSPNFELAIISSRQNFYDRMKFLEAQGFPRNRIIDGRVFKVPNLDFPRLLVEGVAYGIIERIFWHDTCIYPKVLKMWGLSLNLGIKSYITDARITGGRSSNASISVGNFSSVSIEETFEFHDGGHDPGYGHHYEYVGTYSVQFFDWKIPQDIFKNIPQKRLQILIGSDVWIGQGCTLKCTNPDKPLIIGDGAVIASDSVVVKNVPPYAIVGGNPAQFIKYRFPPYIIRALLRIKWWDWDINKIHDNFKYFNDIERFVALHDR